MDKKSIKIVKLDINEEDDFSGVDSIALVESPAIESNWVMFSADVNKDLFEGDLDVSGLPDYVNEPSGSLVVRDIYDEAEDKEMVDGIVELLIKVEDLDNRKQLVIDTIKDFDEQGTIYDLDDFLKRVNVTLSEDFEPHAEKYLEELFDFLGYVDELPIYSTKEEAEEVAVIAGCSGAHEHLVGDLTVWMPCESHEEGWDSLLKDLFDSWNQSRMKSFEDLSDSEWESMKDYLDSVALDAPKEDFNTIKKSSIKAPTAKNLGTSFLDTRSDLTGITTKRRYRYVGGLQSNSREFCKYLVTNFTNKGKVFRKEDINNMSLAGVNTGLGPNGINEYNIFLYRGGNNCKHTWEEVIYKVKGNEVDDVNKEVRTIADLQTIIAPRVPQSELVITPLGIGTNLSKQDFSEQQIVAGPFMIPSKLIYRKDERGEYYVYFSEETIQKIAYKYMQNKYTDNANIEHNEDLGLKDVFVVESWLVADPKRDKSLIYSGGEEYPKGTWYGLMKVKNKNVWEDYVKTGEVKGFSVEGFFIDELLNKSETEG